ncbi:MAG: helix-turn-helix transcriptional regulator [Clostridiales bacterium]|nr:helix-turn-helix transcriptional regulator [Clostridiales bacterium]
MQDLLKNRRIELGLTMKEVANAVGVSEATVSRWESGEIANMKRSRIYSLSKILKISPIQIMQSDDRAIMPKILDKDFISQHEYKIVDAYRSKPDMQQAVDTLLGVQREQNLHIVRKAARNGKYEVFTLTDEEYNQMKAADEALEDAPDYI